MGLRSRAPDLAAFGVELRHHNLLQPGGHDRLRDLLVLDGTLTAYDRLPADRPYYSARCRRDRMNVRVIAGPTGQFFGRRCRRPAAPTTSPLPAYGLLRTLEQLYQDIHESSCVIEFVSPKPGQLPDYIRPRGALYTFDSDSYSSQERRNAWTTHKYQWMPEYNPLPNQAARDILRRADNKLQRFFAYAIRRTYESLQKKGKIRFILRPELIKIYIGTNESPHLDLHGMWRVVRMGHDTQGLKCVRNDDFTMLLHTLSPFFAYIPSPLSNRPALKATLEGCLRSPYSTRTDLHLHHGKRHSTQSST
ncbi:hypothetical protein [Actinomadura meyerae]|nr:MULTISPECIES: hypothetical protein [Actinomadura]